MSPENRLEIPTEMYSFVTTEHFTLSSARGVINGEISSRIGIYFTTLSSLLIAGAFFAQLESMESLAVLFGWIAFPLIVLLGIFTMGRVMILGAMDMIYIRAINRLRYFYSKAAPAIADYLLFPAYDDHASVVTYGGYSTTLLGNFLSAANMINFANSLAATLGVGALVNRYFEMPMGQFLPFGLLVLTVMVVLHSAVGFLIMRSQLRPEYLEERFPRQAPRTDSMPDSPGGRI